jgi:hypothetical protein
MDKPILFLESRPTPPLTKEAALSINGDAKLYPIRQRMRKRAKCSTEEYAVSDPTEPIRRQRLAEINAEPGSREALEVKYGKVWDTQELAQEFEVIGFMAPYVVVRRKVDGVKGSLEFMHNPRFYFNFQAN